MKSPNLRALLSKVLCVLATVCGFAAGSGLRVVRPVPDQVEWIQERNGIIKCYLDNGKDFSPHPPDLTMSKPSIPDLPSEHVATLLAFVREHGIRTAHYVGHADRCLIEGLSGMLGKDAVSIMDMADRWETGFAFWWDEREFPNTPCPERPEWLEGISCYQEGAPDCPDLWIQDTAWNAPDQLTRIIAFRQPKHPPIQNIALLRDARNIPELDGYRRSEEDDITFIRRN